jgi:hypothetical protein
VATYRHLICIKMAVPRLFYLNMLNKVLLPSGALNQ